MNSIRTVINIVSDNRTNMNLVHYDPQTKHVIEYPYTIDKARVANPGFSFAISGLSDKDLAPFGIGVVHLKSPNTTGRPGVSAVEVDPEFIGGHWVQQWKLVAISTEVTSALLVDAVQQAKKQRNQLLADSDWTVAIDSPLTRTELRKWIGYRQALRAVPQQSNFPANIVWPTVHTYETFIPTVTSMMSFKHALAYNELISKVSDALASETHVETKKWLTAAWEYNTQIDKYEGLVTYIRNKLNLTDSHIDSLFELASTH